MVRFLAVALLAWGTLFPVASWAAGACYSDAETRAEQLLRLHSELMVITVTCRTDADAQPLVPAYTNFTKSNYEAIRKAEQTLIAYYKKKGVGDPVSKLDELRTRLGNEFGQQIAAISAPAFCAERRGRVIPASALTQSDVAQQVDHLVASARTYEPTCGHSVVASKKE